MFQKENIKNHKHIIFCDEHYNPLGIARSLGEYGIHPIILATENKVKMLKACKYVNNYHAFSNIESAYSFLMSEYGKETEKPFIYTSDDIKTSFLDEHYEELKDRFFFFNAGEKGKITMFMNKFAINQLAQKHGLNVLTSWRVKRGEIPKDIEFPVITKSISSTMGGWKDDVFICQDVSELIEAYQKIQAPIVLLQKYIEKKNELCLDGFSCAHGDKVLYAIASKYNYILPDTYSSYMTIFNFKDSSLGEKLNAMIREIKFEGIFSIEFLVDQKDELHFCEINFRNSTWSYAATCAGMNLPVLWAQCVSGECEFDSSSFTKKISSGFTALAELEDFRARVIKGKYLIFDWMKEFRNSSCRFYCGKGDLKPAIMALMGIAKRKISKRRNLK